MKKIILALSVLSLALAACGSSTPTTETPAGDSSAAPSAAPAADTAAPAASGEAK